jgi:hypothetical protein
MDIDFYKNNIFTILNDTSYYQNISDYDKHHTLNKIRQLISKCNKLTKDEVNFLLKFDSRTSTFYGLPKIHKSNIIHNICNTSNSEYVEILSPADLKLRPIVAGPECETSRLSCLLDILLKPFLKNVHSYLRDSIDFLNIIPKQVTRETLLVSFDIINLYSNIPHDLGLEALTYWLDKSPELINDRFSKEFILEGIALILNNNIFTFNNQYFKQLKGTAMGTKVAPTYATLVLGYLEDKLYQKLLLEQDKNFAYYFQTHWKRFQDDCFIFWNKSLDDLHKFERILNSLHKDIQFKIQFSPTKLSFLDVIVIKEGIFISTDIYFKSTDSQQYLDFNSCHPKHTKLNIPFNLARRICTIVSDNNILKRRLYELSANLITRNYPLEIIKTGIRKALEIPRKTLLSVKDKTNEHIIPFISTYNPKNKEVFGILKNNINILNSDAKMNSILSNTKIIKSNRQLPNLKRILIKSNFRDITSQPTVSKCLNNRCGLCDYLLEGSSFQFKNKRFYIKEDMNCNVQNVIYVLVCNGCKEFYIGQTGDKLRNRRTVHEQQMRDPSVRQMPLSAHLDQCSKTEPKFYIFPFYKLHNDSVSARLCKEKYFISVFQPKLNNI